MPRANIGIGSNLGDAVANVDRGAAALARLGTVLARSPLYRTTPWGVAGQPDFVNAVVALDTPLGPRALLAALKALETELGRTPGGRWGPRVIDLDILSYGDVAVREPGLEIPHPRLRERAFALIPLADVDPAFAGAAAALPDAARTSVQRIPPGAPRSRADVNWDETLERVRSAAEFCAAAGLARFRIDEADLAVEIRRSSRPGPRSAAPSAEGTTSGATIASNGAAPQSKPNVVVKSDLVGVVRLSRPTVTEGAVITEDRELAYVEALGIRNPVRAGGPGRITGVFVVDGQPVDYGQPLFAIEK